MSVVIAVMAARSWACTSDAPLPILAGQASYQDMSIWPDGQPAMDHQNDADQLRAFRHPLTAWGAPELAALARNRRARFRISSSR
jgi:hypothetical protein